MNTDPPEGYVTTADACRLLRISDRTLRRRVQAGTIEGEYVARPQGSILYVRLPAGVAAAQAAADGEPRKAEEIAEENRENPAGQAAVVAALLDRLESRDAALLAATERAARAEAERDAARQAAAEARAEVARLRAIQDRPWWRKALGLPPA